MAISHGRYSGAAISFATLQFAHFHTDDSADSNFQGIMVHLINRFVEKTGSSGHFDMLQIVVQVDNWWFGTLLCQNYELLFIRRLLGRD